ncbi:uncharacterized protein TNCV_4003151 [Trichonephila clavipes]|nr:uncharacterized protein TNCV_4003151 [Trichonephila clavipes]
MSSLAFFAHANVFHHGGQPVPVELSIASIPEDGTEPKVICITVDHSNLLTTDKDRRANRYINERLSLKSHLPGSVPLEYLDFCVRGKFCHLAQGNKGLIVVKGSDQRKIFEKLGLFTINLEILPHFRDLNDHSLPDHLHDDVHENFDISECTMVKSYRFARYLQYFNKLQAECKKQTSHLVEWIGRYVPVVWHPCSPDLNRLDFYFWGHLKSFVYETPVTTGENHSSRIVVASVDITSTPDLFERVRQSFIRR